MLARNGGNSDLPYGESTIWKKAKGQSSIRLKSERVVLIWSKLYLKRITCPDNWNSKQRLLIDTGGIALFCAFPIVWIHYPLYLLKMSPYFLVLSSISKRKLYVKTYNTFSVYSMSLNQLFKMGRCFVHKSFYELVFQACISWQICPTASHRKSINLPFNS